MNTYINLTEFCTKEGDLYRDYVVRNLQIHIYTEQLVGEAEEVLKLFAKSNKPSPAPSVA